jgi:hypothetical protein
MDTITITVAENDPDVVVSATLNEDAVTIVINEAAVGATGPAGEGATWEVKSSSFTAENDGQYSVVATLTVTDPSPVEGKGFDVFIRNGTATIGGTAYTRSGTTIRRVFHSGAWTNIPYYSPIVSADISDATSAATASKVVIRDASGGAAFDDLTAATAEITGIIRTTGASGAIETNGATADIRTVDPGASVRSSNFKAYFSTGSAILNSVGTSIATFGVSGQNFNFQSGTTVTYDTVSFTMDALSKANMKNTLAIEVGDVGGLSALATTTPGTGVATALAVNVGTAGAFVVNGGALGTPSSGTVTNLTGTASININGTVGATTATTGAFTTITASSTITGSTHNGGTAANDDLTLQGTTNATRTSSYVILQPNGGFVGIGTTTPALALHIVTAGASGVFRAQNTQASGYTGFELFGDAGTQLAAFGTGNSTAGFYPNQMYLGTNTAAALNLYTTSASNVRMYISAAGGVSIGNTTDAGATNLSVTGRITGTAGIVYGTFTVGTFPSTTYLEAVVTDALAPSAGAAVSAGGSAKCKVMYNGSAKIVTAVL